MILRINTYTLILYREYNLIVGHSTDNSNRRTHWRELGCIVKEVYHDSTQQIPICPYRHILSGFYNLNLQSKEIQAFFFPHCRNFRSTIRISQILKLNGDTAIVNQGYGQHILNHLHQQDIVLADFTLEICYFLLRKSLPHICKQLRNTDNGIEGSPYLMAHT